MRIALAIAAGLVAVSSAAAGTIDRNEFRYVRTLRVDPRPSEVAVAVRADGPLFGHAGPGFRTLRIVDGKGDQVPWRLFPPEPAAAPEHPRVLNRGRQGLAAVALLDLGALPAIRDRLELAIPQRGFVGQVTVLGSRDRRHFTRLSETTVYDIRGAGGRVRSTVVTFPPTDFRFLQLRATGIRAIEGATASGAPQHPLVRPLAAGVRIRQGGRATRVVLDLGYRNTPVDRLRVTASAPRYDRPLSVEVRNGGHWLPVADGRTYRYYGQDSPPLELGAVARYVRVTVENGDDPPLAGLQVHALARPRVLAVEHGAPAPIRFFYGGRSRRAPDYEFARLPGFSTQPARGLGSERLNAAYEAPPDTRSFAKKHPLVVDGALALAALVIAVGGFLALRRRA
jgi:uncharacterized protein DUF3999